ncbi:hypothetical protein [Dactylosporangium salmoneum]|uniref:Uncharacterized protein n=1 Tax=Dactylosporangium salmoneum TaxID=53361 RepID=A0ABP5UQY3_9ACTN
MYLRATGFQGLSILDPHLPRQTQLSIGDPGALPSYNPDAFALQPFRAQLDARDGHWGRAELPAGDYWLVTSNYADIELLSCTEGADGGSPAVRPSLS